MPSRKNALRDLIFGRLGAAANDTRRRRTQAVLSFDGLEDRVTPAVHGLAHHAIAHLHHAAKVSSSTTGTTSGTSSVATGTTTSATGSTTSSTGSTTSATGSTGTTTGSTGTTTGSTGAMCGSTGSTTGSSNSTLTSALQTLQNDINSIESNSKTTVGDLANIRIAFQTLANDGLSPSSNSALSSFENSLVTTYANLPSGTTLSESTTGSGGTTLLSQFEALYTSSPSSQQTTDLTKAYDALIAAVNDSNITAANISTINTDYAAVQSAQGSSSTATYPYFNLVTGQALHGGRGGGCS